MVALIQSKNHVANKGKSAGRYQFDKMILNMINLSIPEIPFPKPDFTLWYGVLSQAMNASAGKTEELHDGHLGAAEGADQPIIFFGMSTKKKLTKKFRNKPTISLLIDGHTWIH